METFVTRSIHDLALGAVEDQFQKVWQSLGRDYFTQDVINEKLADINNTVANNYTLLTRTDSFEAFCNGAFHKIEWSLEEDKSKFEGVDSSLDDLDRRVRKKADTSETVRLQQELKRHALYDDFKELYNKTMLPMKVF